MTQTFLRISKNLIVLVNLKFLNGQIEEKMKSKKYSSLYNTDIGRGTNVLR